MILLMMVAVCLNACIVLEQPYSSFFEFYPRFRELVCMLQSISGQTAVLWHPKVLPSFDCSRDLNDHS